MIPKEQVTGILALETEATSVPQVGHTLMAQRMAVHAISNQVEILLFLAASPASSSSQSCMGMAG